MKEFLNPKSLLDLTSRTILEDLTFQRCGTKWTRHRLKGKNLATNDVLNLDKEGERIKARIST